MVWKDITDLALLCEKDQDDLVLRIGSILQMDPYSVTSVLLMELQSQEWNLLPGI